MAWVFGAHHVPDFDELGLLIEFLAWGLALSCFLWVLYIALEPFVRRRWPATLVSWSRLVAGSFRDPLVGRDILAGCFLAMLSIPLERLGWFVPYWLGHPPPQPYSGPQWVFLGARPIVAQLALWLMLAFFVWFALLFVLLLLRVMLRKQWAAAIAWVLLFTVLGSSDPGGWLSALIFSGLAVFVMTRFGLLALVANHVVFNILQHFPVTSQGSAWYAGIGLTGILLIAAVALYGFYTSLGGRPVFGGAILEE
jgi:serine/threonine-protein kinase